MKYILLDLDGTILDFNASEKNAFKNTIFKFTDIIPSDYVCEKFSEVNEELFNEFSKGHLKRIEFQQLRFKRMSDYLNIDIDEVEFNKFYVENLKIQADLYSDAIDLLEYLNNKYELYVASNGMKNVQINRLKEAKIFDYFKDIFISEEIGANKPDIKFFKYIFDKIGNTNLDEYLIIGDRYDTDILGGLNAGIKGILVNRSDKTYNDICCVKSLSEIKGVL